MIWEAIVSWSDALGSWSVVALVESMGAEDTPSGGPKRDFLRADSIVGDEIVCFFAVIDLDLEEQ